MKVYFARVHVGYGNWKLFVVVAKNKKECNKKIITWFKGNNYPYKVEKIITKELSNKFANHVYDDLASDL